MAFAMRLQPPTVIEMLYYIYQKMSSLPSSGPSDGDDDILVHIHFVFVNSSILLRSASISYGLNSPGSILPF